RRGHRLRLIFLLLGFPERGQFGERAQRRSAGEGSLRQVRLGRLTARLARRRRRRLRTGSPLRWAALSGSSSRMGWGLTTAMRTRRSTPSAGRSGPATPARRRPMSLARTLTLALWLAVLGLSLVGWFTARGGRPSFGRLALRAGLDHRQ